MVLVSYSAISLQGLNLSSEYLFPFLANISIHSVLVQQSLMDYLSELPTIISILDEFDLYKRVVSPAYSGFMFIGSVCPSVF